MARLGPRVNLALGLSRAWQVEEDDLDVIKENLGIEHIRVEPNQSGPSRPKKRLRKGVRRGIRTERPPALHSLQVYRPPSPKKTSDCALQ